VRRKLLVLTLAGLVLADPTTGIELDQIDDFENQTTQGWQVGFRGDNPANVVDPADSGNRALQMTAEGGGGSNSRLISFNTLQWQGDYTGAGVTRVLIDVNNVGGTALTLRFSLDGPGGQFSMTDGIAVPSGSGWLRDLEFPITSADLTSVGGVDPDATLADVAQLRFMHSTVPAWRSQDGIPAIVATLLIDNVQGLPEPRAPLLQAAAIAGLGALGRRRAQKRSCRLTP
jgi:hypothetical protein